MGMLKNESCNLRQCSRYKKKQSEIMKKNINSFC